MAFGVCAMFPKTKDTPPTFYHVTWKQDQYGKWKTVNTPQYSALFKDLRNRNPMTESMHIQLHGSDFAQLPLSGNMKWLIEFPPAWSWFLSWAPRINIGFLPSSALPSRSLRRLRHHPWLRLYQQRSLSQHMTSRHNVQPRQCPSSQQPCLSHEVGLH